MEASDEQNLRLPAALTGVFVVGLLLGVAGGGLLARAPAASPGPDTSGLAGEVARLNATAAALNASLLEAQRTAAFAANEAGVSELAARLAEVEGLLSESRKTDAFEPLKTLVAAATHTPWAPVLNTSVRPVRENASRLLEAMMYGNDSEVAPALGTLRHAEDAFDADARLLYLPFHGANPEGAAVELTENMTGIYLRKSGAAPERAPTLHLARGATMMVEATNNDVIVHNFAVPDLTAITRAIQPGETVGLLVKATAVGNYRFFCDIPGHDATMFGYLNVGPAA